MLSTKARPITRHEYAMIPVGAPNYQLIEGDLVVAPSLSSYHQNIAGRVYRLIGNFLDSTPLGVVFIAPLDARRALSLYRLAENSDTPAATYKAKQKFANAMLPGLTIDLAELFAS
jgi:hypothetical protein